MVTPNPSRYLASIAEELSCQAQRVRDLIGSTHWFTDGHHKEYLLSNLLTRHCPSSILVSRGFAINPRDTTACSREQDILIIDTSKEAPIFNQGALAITSPRSILAAISVKTMLDKREILDSVSSLNSVSQVAYQSGTPTHNILSAAFFFEPADHVAKTPTIVYNYLQEAFAHSAHSSPSLNPGSFLPDYISSSRDLFYRLGRESEASYRAEGFHCPGFAAAILLAAILAHIASSRGLRDPDIIDFAEIPSVFLFDPPSAHLTA